MGLIIFIIIVSIIIVCVVLNRNVPQKVDISSLPETFVVFDLETTGLDPYKHEIIEIGAIKVSRDSDQQQTYQALVKPEKKITKKIEELTGITNEMIEANGIPIKEAVEEFRSFVGENRLVSFNSDFDMSFMRETLRKLGDKTIKNKVSCALKMARRAYPGLASYKLAELARLGKLSQDDTHRALGDCKRTLIVYASCASKLGKAW